MSSELQAHLREERRAHSSTTSELNALKSEQMTFKEQVEDIKEKFEHSQLRCEELEADIASIKLQLKEKCEQLADAEKELQHARSAAAATSDLVTELDASKLSLATKDDECLKLVNENDYIRQQLSESESKINELSERLVASRSTSGNKHSENVEPTSIENLKSQLEDQKMVCELAKVAVSVQSRNDDSDSTRQQTTDNQDDYIDALQSEITMLTDQLDSTKKENEEISTHLSGVDEQLSSTSNEMECLRKKYVDAVDECDRLRDKLHAADDDSDRLSDSVKELMSQKKSVEEDLKSSQAANDNFKGQLAALAKDRDDLQSRLNRTAHDAEEQIRSIQATMSKLETGKESLIVEVSSLHARLEAASHTDKVFKELEARDLEQKALLQEKDARILSLKQLIDSDNANKPSVHESEPLEQKENNELSDADQKLMEHQVKCQQLNLQVESLEAKLQEITDSNVEMRLEISTLKSERDRLAAQVRMSPRVDEMNADGVEYRGLQRQIIELKQKLQVETKLKQNLEQSKEVLDEALANEKKVVEEAKAEVQKLEMSISMLMNSHETEMASLQTALSDADCKMKDLEVQVTNYSRRSNDLGDVVRGINAELSDLKTCRTSICDMFNDLATQNSRDVLAFQQQLCSMLQQASMSDNSPERDLSPSLPAVHEIAQSTLYDGNVAPKSSSPLPNLSAIDISSIHTESLSTVSHYGKLSKEDLVAKLSDQTKHELILRKHLEEARQSLAFYRSAIDNIIDCLGTAMPGVKKWANDVLNVSVIRAEILYCIIYCKSF